MLDTAGASQKPSMSGRGEWFVLCVSTYTTGMGKRCTFLEPLTVVGGRTMVLKNGNILIGDRGVLPEPESCIAEEWCGGLATRRPP